MESWSDGVMEKCRRHMKPEAGDLAGFSTEIFFVRTSAVTPQMSYRLRSWLFVTGLARVVTGVSRVEIHESPANIGLSRCHGYFHPWRGMPRLQRKHCHGALGQGTIGAIE